MSKIVPSAKVGVPVPAAIGDAASVSLYYGPKGFTPNYDQAERIEKEISLLEETFVDGQAYWSFDTSALPALTEGDYDLYFTLEDDVGNESDFSPVITIPLDHEPPAALGQPVVL